MNAQTQLPIVSICYRVHYNYYNLYENISWVTLRLCQINVSGLGFGKRMVASEEVMNEIFGEEEMAVFYRVAMEMEHADEEKNCHLFEQGGPGTEIIRIDDDSEMEDVSRVVRMGSTMGGI